MSEEEQAINFIRQFSQERGTIPSVRRLCREVNMTPPRFYRLFGSLESLVEKAGLKLDVATKERISSTRKATKRRTREKRRQLPRDSNPTMTVKSESTEQPAAPTFEEIQQNLKDEEEARQQRLENIGKFAAQIEILALDGDPKISGPVIDALSGVVPTILEHKYHIEASLKDLVEADHTLHQVQKERKRLRAKEIQLDGERLEIQRARELLKRDKDKASLLEHVEKLEWEKKISINRFNEAYKALKRSRVLFSELWSVASKCPNCPSTFVQNMTVSHRDILDWVTSGKYHMRLSFETEGAPKLGYRT